MQSLRLSAWSSALPTSHHREHYPTGSSPLALPRHGLYKEEPPFTNGRFDALASCLLERLLLREGAVVGKLSALKADDLPEDLAVHRSELGDCSATRVHVTHPYRVTVTSAFNMRTFRLSGAVFLSYNSGPNR